MSEGRKDLSSGQRVNYWWFVNAEASGMSVGDAVCLCVTNGETVSP